MIDLYKNGSLLLSMVQVVEGKCTLVQMRENESNVTTERELKDLKYFHDMLFFVKKQSFMS